jgi:hypothetical protein
MSQKSQALRARWTYETRKDAFDTSHLTLSDNCRHPRLDSEAVEDERSNSVHQLRGSGIISDGSNGEGVQHSIAHAMFAQYGEHLPARRILSVDGRLPIRNPIPESYHSPNRGGRHVKTFEQAANAIGDLRFGRGTPTEMRGQHSIAHQRYVLQAEESA